MIQFQKLLWAFAAATAICPAITRSAPLVPVSETRHSHVEGFVHLYDPYQIPNDVVLVDSDSFSDQHFGSASVSEGLRYASVSAESWGQRTISSDRIEVELESLVSYSRQGHFMDLQGESFNEYRLTFELTQPSTVHLTGFIDSGASGGIETDARIELAGWQVSQGSFTFDTTLQLDAGRYSFVASSSVVAPYGVWFTDGEYGFNQLELTAVFTPIPEASPRTTGAAITLLALLHWRRRMRTQVQPR